MKHWFVYILRCADDSLYSGMTDDLYKRVAAHNDGVGAKYTRGRGPVQLIYWERRASRSDALRREAQLKKLSRQQKLALCEDFCGAIEYIEILEEKVLCVVDDRALPAESYITLLQQICPGDYDALKTASALHKSCNVTAWVGEMLIGCVRILSDGYYVGQIAEHVVLPSYRDAGVADKLWQLAEVQLPKGAYSK